MKLIRRFFAFRVRWQNQFWSRALSFEVERVCRFWLICTKMRWIHRNVSLSKEKRRKDFSILFSGVDHALRSATRWFEYSMSRRRVFTSVYFENEPKIFCHVHRRHETSGKIDKRKFFFEIRENQWLIDVFLKINAVVNRAAGKGYENEVHYENMQFKFCPIENIHVMRSSLQKLIESSRFSWKPNEFYVWFEFEFSLWNEKLDDQSVSHRFRRMFVVETY